MNKLISHLAVALLAATLAASSLYLLTETDRVVSAFYGYPPPLTIPPNTNATLPLAYVSDQHETGNLTVLIPSDASSWKMSSLPKPASYSFTAAIDVSVRVNKSAFVLLESSQILGTNRTVKATAFHSTNFPPGSSGYAEYALIQSNMELNRLYQLKIGNYETFIINQTGELKFTTQKTNRTLEVELTSPLAQGLDPLLAPPPLAVVITFTRQPNLYLAAGFLVIDAVLVTIYSITYRGRKASEN